MCSPTGTFPYHRILTSLTVRITMTGLAYGSPLVRMPECRTQQAWGFSANSENNWQHMQEAKCGNAVCLITPMSTNAVLDYELIPAGSHNELHRTFKKNQGEKGTAQQLIN